MKQTIKRILELLFLLILYLNLLFIIILSIISEDFDFFIKNKIREIAKNYG